MSSLMRLLCVALYLLASLPSVSQAQTDKRVALVIGNSAYVHTGKLTNPKNDATDVAVALKQHGFRVIEGYDLDKSSFDQKVRDFATSLKGAEVGLFFFAGHGLQVAGQNYLLPIDAKAEGAEALDFEMVRVDVVHRAMERQANTNILFLDACRDNPLSRNLARSMGTRSTEVGRGLAAVESGIGTLISFSTQPGNVALDGTGRNSPFAGALVKQLSTARDDLSAILIEVRNDVMRETQRKQVPWEHSALTGRFYFSAAPAAMTVPKNDAPPAPTPPAPTKPLSSFNGTWLTKIVCPATPNGTLGFSRQLTARIQNGVFQGDDGTKDTAGWMNLQGTVGADGRLALQVNGLNKTSATAVDRAPPGASFRWTLTGQLQEKSGKGKRDAGRECDVTFTRQ